MRVVVDTSTWSQFLRRELPPDNPQRRKLETLIEQQRPVVLLGVVIQELLQGVRESAKFDRLRDYLQDFPLLEMRRKDYVAAARIGNLCRSKGIHLSIVDCQIAAACIEHDCELLTCDQDFERIAEHVPLRLL